MGRVYAIYYFGHFLMTLVGIILILFAWGKTRELLYKNEKTAKMLQKIKELWQRITDEEDHYE